MAQEKRRAKRKLSMQQVFSDILCQPAGENDEGILSHCKKKTKTVQQALALSIIEKALEGDLKAVDFVARMTASNATPTEESPLSVTIKVVE